MNFAQNLKMLRKNHDKTQAEMAFKFNLTPKSISFWENGEREPNYEILCALADYFGVTTDQLLGREPLPNENMGEEVRKLEKDQTQRLEECLLAFVERVANGGATTEAETQALPAVAQVLVDLQDRGKDSHFDSDSTISRLQQFLTEERKRDHSHT